MVEKKSNLSSKHPLPPAMDCHLTEKPVSPANLIEPCLANNLQKYWDSFYKETIGDLYLKLGKSKTASTLKNIFSFRSGVVPPPILTAFFSDMTDSEGFTTDEYAPGGSIIFGYPDKTVLDGLVTKITYPGDPRLDSSDKVSPEFAQQIRTTIFFGYGQYKVRAKMAPCATGNEGLVRGFFTYWRNGDDQNANGMIDNSEIDVEILCSDPSRIYLTIWTDYTNEHHFSKVTRSIDMKTGAYKQTRQGQELNRWDLNDSGYIKDANGNLINLPGFSFDNGDWIEFGFLWKADSVSYTMKWQGAHYALWTYTNSRHIPNHVAPFMINMWHHEFDWTTKSLVDYPSENVETLVDSFSYQAE